MTRDQAIRKIKACLRLAGSPNSVEAETALRQAKWLMSQHGLTDTDIQLSDVRDVHSKQASESMPPRYITELAHYCAQAFSADHFADWEETSMWEGRWRLCFVGVESDAELACYCFDVLRRQLQRDIRRYQKLHCRRCKRGTRIQRTHNYAHGWIRSARRLLDIFDQNPKRLALAKQSTHEKGVEPISRRNLPAAVADRSGAVLHGMNDGSNAQLNRGIGASQRPALAAEGERC